MSDSKEATTWLVVFEHFNEIPRILWKWNTLDALYDLQNGQPFRWRRTKFRLINGRIRNECLAMIEFLKCAFIASITKMNQCSPKNSAFSKAVASTDSDREWQLEKYFMNENDS